MRMVLFIAAVMSSTGVIAQGYGIGHLNTVFRDTLRDNREIPTNIYYPQVTVETGSLSPESSVTRFPVICFAHGYMLTSEAYLNIREALVPAGFILVFPEGESGLFPSHEEYSKDLAFVLGEIYNHAAHPSSPLYGITDTVKCLMGHSMGGGALFAAANMRDDLRAVVALAPYNTSPSAIQAASSVTIPTLIFAGSNDCITPPEKHQLPIYRFSASDNKSYILIKGGNHCQMGSHSSLCSFGEAMTFCDDAITEDEQHLILNRYILTWIRFFLRGDIKAGSEFDNAIISDSSIEYLRSHTLLCDIEQ